MKMSNQKGFTLLEIALAMGVGGLLLSGLVLAIFQTFGTTKQSVNEIAALENVQNAAYRITQDVKKAGTTTLVSGGPSATSLVLDWTIWYDAGGNFIANGEYHRSKYVLSDRKLQRSYGTYLPASPPSLPIPDSNFTWQPQATVANFISATQFSLQGQIILATITSSPEGRPESAEQKTYHLYLQPKVAPVQ